MAKFDVDVEELADAHEDVADGDFLVGVGEEFGVDAFVAGAMEAGAVGGHDDGLVEGLSEGGLARVVGCGGADVAAAAGGVAGAEAEFEHDDLFDGAGEPGELGDVIDGWGFVGRVCELGGGFGGGLADEVHAVFADFFEPSAEAEDVFVVGLGGGGGGRHGGSWNIFLCESARGLAPTYEP